MLSTDEIEEISKVYYDDVYKFCLYLSKNDTAAEDITQETFLTLVRKGEGITNDNIKGWLISTANHLFLKHIYKNKKEKEKVMYLEDDGLIESLSAKIDHRYISDVSSKHIDLVFSKLSKKDLILYEMYYVNDMPYAEISKQLGVSENTLYVRVKRMKDKVKKIIDEEIMFF